MTRKAREEAKTRQILVDDNSVVGSNNSAKLSSLSEKELIEKAKLAFEAIAEEFEGIVKVHAVRKLP